MRTKIKRLRALLGKWRGTDVSAVEDAFWQRRDGALRGDPPEGDAHGREGEASTMQEVKIDQGTCTKKSATDYTHSV